MLKQKSKKSRIYVAEGKPNPPPINAYIQPAAVTFREWRTVAVGLI